MISCQFSLYRLGVEDLSPAIDAAVAEMRALGWPGLKLLASPAVFVQVG
jgi:hypothetical protein